MENVPDDQKVDFEDPCFQCRTVQDELRELRDKQKEKELLMERHCETIMELMAEQKPLEILIKEAVAKM